MSIKTGETHLKALRAFHPVENLIDVLREDEGDPTVHADNLARRGVGHPFYQMTKVLIRADGGVDWSNGIGTAEQVGPDFKIEKHHIFPKAVLKQAGYDTGSSLAHKQLVTGNIEKFMIPMDEALWEVDNFEAFLSHRRELIAERIKCYMRGLRAPVEADSPRMNIQLLTTVLENGEGERVEFKSTLRWHLHAKRMDKNIEHAALKTIAAFLNSDGGTLLIGVDDHGEVIGLKADQFQTEDKMMLHLTNIIKDRMGTSPMRFVDISVVPVDGVPVLRVDCQRGIIPAYLKHANEEHFYVRTGPATSQLPTSEVHQFVQDRFHGR